MTIIVRPDFINNQYEARKKKTVLDNDIHHFRRDSIFTGSKF